MKASSLLVSTLLVSALLLLAGCSTAAPGGGATGEESEPRMRVEQLARGQQGPTERGVTIADSAEGLEAKTGVQVPDSGEGLYICAHAGERPTGGYRVGVSDEEDNNAVRVTLREPGKGEMVTQALTSPYEVAVVRGVSAEELSFVEPSGESLNWPVDRP